MSDRPTHPHPAKAPKCASTEVATEFTAASPGADWTPQKTFKEMYLDGDVPWPEEPLLQNDRHPFEVADEYLTLLGHCSRAHQNSDAVTLRRMSGELDAADTALARLDTYAQAAVLTRITRDLTHAAQNPTPHTPTPPKRAQVLPEAGRFNGPAPFFRRGRAYIQSLAPAFTLAAEGHGEFVSRRPDDADQFLRVVEASNDVTDLHDFIAGAVHELHRQLSELVSHPITGSK